MPFLQFLTIFAKFYCREKFQNHKIAKLNTRKMKLKKFIFNETSVSYFYWNHKVKYPRNVGNHQIAKLNTRKMWFFFQSWIKYPRNLIPLRCTNSSCTIFITKMSQYPPIVYYRRTLHKKCFNTSILYTTDTLFNKILQHLHIVYYRRTLL